MEEEVLNNKIMKKGKNKFFHCLNCLKMILLAGWFTGFFFNRNYYFNNKLGGLSGILFESFCSGGIKLCTVFCSLYIDSF